MGCEPCHLHKNVSMGMAMAGQSMADSHAVCRKSPPSPNRHDQDAGASQPPSTSPARKQVYSAGSVLNKAKLWDLRASQDCIHHQTGKPKEAIEGSRRGG